MIHSISGKLEKVGEDYAVVNLSGLSFRVYISAVTVRALPSPGGEVKFLTHLHVREDILALYGFTGEEELGFFEALTTVSGIGPRSAMGIMSLAPVAKMKAAISAGESELLQKSSGVGKKTAERIVLELRDKIAPGGAHETVRLMERDQDVYEALTSLGYTGTQAKKVLAKVGEEITETKDRLREALKLLKDDKKT